MGRIIYDHNTNELQLWTNNSQTMTIDNDGVGIGITNPTKKLEIVATNQGGGENNTLRFVDTDVTSQANQQTGRIEFFTSDTTQSGVHAYILGATSDANGNGDLRFGTGTAGSAVEKLRITSDGLVGIGTDDPKTKLHVESTTGTETRVTISQQKTYGAGTGTAARAGLDLAIREASHTADNRTFARIETGPEAETTSSASFLSFSTRTGGNIGEKLRITSDGKVGIGLTNPSDDLTIENVHKEGLVGNAIKFYRDAGNYIILEGNNSAFLQFRHGSTDLVRITSAGNVGIGTDNPVALLNPHGTAALSNADQVVLISDSNADDAIGRGGNLGFAGYVNGNLRTLAAIGGLKTNAGNSFNGDLALYTRRNGQANLDERLRIASDGKVGIGTTNPQSKLDVQGDIDFNNNVIIASSSTSNNIDHIWHDDNSSYGKGGTWNFVSDSTKRSTGNSAIQIGYLKSSGGGHFLDSVGIGTTNPNSKLHLSGTGTQQIRVDTDGTALSIHDHSEFIGFIGNDAGKLFINAGGTEDTLSLRTNGTEKLRITSDGDITTSGSITTQTSNAFYENNRRVLEVHGGATQGWLAVGASRTDTDAYVGGINFVNSHGQIDNHRFLGYIRLKSTHVNTNQYGNAVLKGQLEFATKRSSAGISTTTPDMVISPSGSVGIGTDDPAVPLDINTQPMTETI